MKRNHILKGRLLIGLFILIVNLFLVKTYAQTVYVTKTGKKYHAEGCQYLSKSSYSMTLSDALSTGYLPCNRCGGGSTIIPKSKNHSRKKARPTQNSQSNTPQCQGITKKGSQCSRKAKVGSSFCWQHGG